MEINKQQESSKPARLAPEQIVKKLKEEIKNNQALNAICYLFANRERARQQVTLANLMIVMQKEGFKFTKKQCEDALKFLASLNIGTIEYSTSGDVIKLKDIDYTLQSIGASALSTAASLDKFQPVNNYKKLPVVDVPKKIEEPPKVEPVVSAPVPTSTGYETSFTVFVNKKPITLRIPRKLSTDQLLEVLAKLYPDKEW